MDFKCEKCECKVTRKNGLCRKCSWATRKIIKIKPTNNCIDCKTEILVGSKRCNKCQAKERSRSSKEINPIKNVHVEQLYQKNVYLIIVKYVEIK